MNSVKISGVLVAVQGVGILIRGRSGSGKSLAALNLMRRGHRLVSDDMVEVVPGPLGEPVGKPVEAEVRIEVRGLGIFPARSLFPDGTISSFPVHLVVELDSYDPIRDAGRLTPLVGTFKLLDKPLEWVKVPVPDGMDPAFLIEMVARMFMESGTVKE